MVLGEYGGGRRAAMGAFVMPNGPIDPETPLAALEEVAGGKPCREILPGKWKAGFALLGALEEVTGGLCQCCLDF